MAILNMNCLIVLVVVFCAFNYSECMSAEKRFGIFKSAAEDCAGLEKATAEDLAQIIAHKPATTYGQKCIRACLGERFGLINNKKVDPEGAAFLASMAYEGPNSSKREADAREIASGCVDVTDDDRCEAVAKIAECSERIAKEKGLSTGLEEL